MNTKPEAREYFEVTLHMQGGGQVIFAADDFTSKRSQANDGGYTHINWTSTEWDDLPKLSSVDLPRLTAITTRLVKETA